MGKQLSTHFHSNEFTCKGNAKGICTCKGEEVDMDPSLISLLELVRNHFGKPVTITSGYRCLTYNRSIGSGDESQHPKKTAADIQVAGVAPGKVHAFLADTTGGLGSYSTFTHLDTRPKKARWSGP
jgi:uncharacterized protein YcbK (DUF882 family)